MNDADRKAGALRGARRTSRAAATRNFNAAHEEKVQADEAARTMDAPFIVESLLNVVVRELYKIVDDQDDILQVRQPIRRAMEQVLSRALAPRDAYIDQLKQEMWELGYRMDKVILDKHSSVAMAQHLINTFNTYRKDK